MIEAKTLMEGFESSSALVKRTNANMIIIRICLFFFIINNYSNSIGVSAIDKAIAVSISSRCLFASVLRSEIEFSA